MASSRVAWLSPDDPHDSFPAVNAALSEPDGLLAAGGDLSPDRLLIAYRQGIFPWYEEGQPLLWWSPDPRCVFLPGDFHLARRMKQEFRKTDAEIRVNTAFTDVVRACAGPRRSGQGTWITPDMLVAYEQLHRLGWAHSVEVWRSDKLCGGLYGLAIGKAFFGESMFSKSSNASKMALLYLAERLNSGDFKILDCQIHSAHLSGLGARVVPRPEFIELLQLACEKPGSRSDWPAGSLHVPDLLVR